MNRSTQIILLASFAAAAVSPVHAQTIAASVAEYRGGDGTRTTNEDIARGMNIADCEDPDAEIVLSLDMNPGQVDIWHSNGQSVDCINAENARSANAEMRTCIHLTNLAVGADRQVVIPVSTLAAGDEANGNGNDVCANRNRTTYRLFLLDTDAIADSGMIASWGAVDVVLDSQSPGVPSVENATLAGTNVPVEWDPAEDGVDAVTNMRGRVEIFTDGCGMTDVEGAPKETVRTNLGETSYTVDLAALEVGDGGQVGVRIATEDQAGNIGDFSSEVCVTRVTGQGFCDVVEGGCPEGCSAGGVNPKNTAVFAFLVLAFVVSRRKQ